MKRVLNELIVRVNSEVRECKGKLLVEDSGREIASLQGHVAGYRYLVDFIAAEFHLLQTFLEDNNEEPINVADLDDEQVSELLAECEELQQAEEWTGVLGRVDARTESLKNELLFSAEKSRDLDLSQGQWKAMTSYTRFFNHVHQVNAIRVERQQEREKEPELDFASNASKAS